MDSSQDLSPQTVENFQQRIQELACVMSRVADSLHQGESVELGHLADEIGSVQTMVQGFSEQLKEHPLLADSERYAIGVNDIVESCRLISRRQQAIGQLKRLQLVKSYDQNDQESFVRLQNHLEGILHSLTGGTIEERQQAVHEVLGEESSVQILYEMINRPEDLADDRWVEAQRIMTKSFGRHVALAVIRGRAR